MAEEGDSAADFEVAQNREFHQEFVDSTFDSLISSEPVDVTKGTCNGAKKLAKVTPESPTLSSTTFIAPRSSTSNHEQGIAHAHNIMKWKYQNSRARMISQILDEMSFWRYGSNNI